jgi:3-oxoacyl-[acyl-carrier-protein] synthase III
MKRQIRILGTGKYLPGREVLSEEIDAKLGLEKGWAAGHTGVEKRHYVKDETAAFMGARAVEEALKNAGLTIADIDCIIGASGTMDQHIPCNAALIKSELKCSDPRIFAFDVNATCLSFITALDMISYSIAAGRFRNVLFVSSEIASVGLDWKSRESCALFGDGAVAVIAGRTKDGETSGIICSAMETYIAGAHMAEVTGSGSRLHPSKRATREQILEDSMFKMDGRGIFKAVSKVLSGFVVRLFEGQAVAMSDCVLHIPHQASGPGVKLMMKKLGIAPEKYMYILPDHGNMIAASMPCALHEAITGGRMKRGDIVMLWGVGAGMTLGGVVLEY